jgi:5-methylcytosine-specific restriction protein A
MHPFFLGKEYGRGRLLDFLGSKQGQSGVLWGEREPGCLICTSGGRHGKKAGYTDETLDDGSWWYFGQGQSGDQSLQNAANSKLAVGQRSVLLFTTREPTPKEIAVQGYGKLYAFRGSFNISAYEFVVPLDGPRQNDRLLRFRLIPSEGTGAELTEDIALVTEKEDLAALQNQLNTQSQNLVPVMLGLREYRKRSTQVHRYALLRATGVCEGCRLPAPFRNEFGQAFLEVHHLLRLADYGPDIPINVAALCPNCHRRAHCSLDRDEFCRKLREYVFKAEQTISMGSEMNFGSSRTPLCS